LIFLGPVVARSAQSGGTRIVLNAHRAMPRAGTRILVVAAALLMIVGLFPAGVSAVPPSGAPTLITPAEGATVSSNPILSWSAVSGATKYRVQVSTNPGFSALVYNVDTTNRKATPPADLPLGLLYWRVAGTDGGAGIGPFTQGTFTKAWGNAPVIDAPADGDTVNFPTEPVLFDWQPLAGAKSYTLEIDDAADFIGALSYTTNNTQFTLIEPQTINQLYFWRLRATSSTGGVVSDWTITRQYTYAWPTVPTLLSPPDAVGTPVRDITFSWSPVLGAKNYELQISPNGDWTNNLLVDQTVLGTKYNLPVNINNGSYYWRVRARDAKGPQNNGGWSSEWQFTRNWPQHPDEIAPFYDGVTTPIVGLPRLEWTPVPLASYYEVWIGDDPTFPGSPGGSYIICNTNHTAVTPYVRSAGPVGGEPGGCNWDVNPGSTYYWKVRAIDGTGNIIGIFSEQNASDTWRFIYLGDLPTLVAPADNATVEVPTLIWNAVDNVERYVVHINKFNGTSALVATTYATSFTPLAALNPADGPFSWYVTTIDGQNNAGVIPASSSWFHFSLTPMTTDITFAISSPDNGGSYVRMPRMNWNPYTGAAYYKVWYGPSGGLYFATPLSGGAKLAYSGFTYSAIPLSSGTYKFFIEAFDVSDVHVASSEEWTFTITAPDVLASGNYTSPPRCTLIATCTTLADTPTLEWDAVPGAGAYEVTLANDAEFTNEIKRYRTIFTKLTPRESYLDQQAGQAIYWFVKPCIDFAVTRCGPDSSTNANDNASAFRKNSAAVEVLTPTASQSIADLITFTWTPYLTTNQNLAPPVPQEARSYKIEVSLVADFATIFDTLTVDQATYTPFSKTYPEGPLYWRVQAIDGSGNNLTKSPARLVNKSSPALTPTFPTNGSTQAGVPYFQWNPQAFAATYLIEVYKNGDTLFSPANLVLTQTTKFSAWAPTTSLASGDYAWRVRRSDADNRAGPWSAARTFTLQAALPTLTAPANGATVGGNAILFTWGGVAGGVQYRIEVAATCAFSAILYTQTTVMTSWAPTTTYPDGSYCWRIKALDAANNTISQSTTRTFNVGTAPPPPPTGTTFVPIDPVRLLDTRTNVGLTGQFTANTARLLTVAGRLGVPNDAVAITANLTVVGQQQAGYMSVTPVLDNSPSTSALNFPLGDVRANNITSPLGSGKLSIVYKAGAGKKTHVLLDVTGYFLENNGGATYKVLTPVRLLDTRFANGLSGPFAAHTVRTFDVAGRGSVPANATAVTGNLTVVGQTQAGYVTLGPTLADNPATSTINFPMGDTRANGITVRLNTGTGGSLSAIYIANAGKTTHLLFDVTGYYVQDLTGSKFYPLDPGRVLDSRNGTGLSGTFKSDIARTLAVRGHVGVPVAALAVSGNLTVVGQTAAGYVSMTQATTNNPTTSTLNFPLGDVRANGVTGPLSGAGNVGLVYKATSGKATHLILDITGYFGP
jgi:hypothetical protein